MKLLFRYHTWTILAIANTVRGWFTRGVYSQFSYSLEQLLHFLHTVYVSGLSSSELELDKCMHICAYMDVQLNNEETFLTSAAYFTNLLESLRWSDKRKLTIGFSYVKLSNSRIVVVLLIKFRKINQYFLELHYWQRLTQPSHPSVSKCNA